MFILTPINANEKDCLKYWTPINDSDLARLWDEVVCPSADFIQEKFPEKYKQLLAPPVKFIDPDEGRDVRISGMNAATEDMNAKNAEYPFMGMQVLDALYVTKGTPVPGSNKLSTVKIGQRMRRIACEPKICFINSVNYKELEANIYNFFMIHFCMRLQEAFYEKFPHAGNWSLQEYISECPAATSQDALSMTEDEIADYLSGNLISLRMENTTFQSMASQKIRDSYQNMIKNHAHIISESLSRQDFSFIEAIDSARADKLELVPAESVYFPLLSVWMKPRIGNVFCAISIYKDGQLWDEINMEMYNDGETNDPTKWLYRWYDLLSDMEDDCVNKTTTEATKWGIVMVDLIHG